VYWWGDKERAFFFVTAGSCEDTSAVRDWSGHSKDSYVCYGGEGSCWYVLVNASSFFLLALIEINL
jgi:hypothetical protein